jgi:hypothetical protein
MKEEKFEEKEKVPDIYFLGDAIHKYAKGEGRVFFRLEGLQESKNYYVKVKGLSKEKIEKFLEKYGLRHEGDPFDFKFFGEIKAREIPHFFQDFDELFDLVFMEGEFRFKELILKVIFPPLDEFEISGKDSRAFERVWERETKRYMVLDEVSEFWKRLSELKK